jgi:DNA repair protein RecO (recombination protein O)
MSAGGTHSRTYKTRGIVMRARNLGEADRIVTLFTEERGKLDAVAKGVRRAKSQVAGKLEFASEAMLGVHRGRSLDVIASAEIACSHWEALVDPGKFAVAHLLVELIDAFCEPDLAMPEVYALLQGALTALARTAEPLSLVPRFELRLLGALGLAPEAETCLRCGGALAGAAAWADLEAGGLTCARCRPHRADALALNAAEVDNFGALGASREGGRRAALLAAPAVARAVDAFVTHHLGKRLRSQALLADLAQGPAWPS